MGNNTPAVPYWAADWGPNPTTTCQGVKSQFSGLPAGPVQMVQYSSPSSVTPYGGMNTNYDNATVAANVTGTPCYGSGTGGPDGGMAIPGTVTLTVGQMNAALQKVGTINTQGLNGNVRLSPARHRLIGSVTTYRWDKAEHTAVPDGPAITWARGVIDGPVAPVMDG